MRRKNCSPFYENCIIYMSYQAKVQNYNISDQETQVIGFISLSVCSNCQYVESAKSHFVWSCTVFNALLLFISRVTILYVLSVTMNCKMCWFRISELIWTFACILHVSCKYLAKNGMEIKLFQKWRTNAYVCGTGPFP